MPKQKVAANGETTSFDRDAMAQWYAKQHLAYDSGLQEIYYLPENAPPREIRFLEVNTQIPDTGALEPIDFGVDAGADAEHKLFILDVTPAQFDTIQKGRVRLPGNWSLQGKKKFDRNSKRPQPS